MKHLWIYLTGLMLALTSALALPAQAQISIPLAGVNNGRVMLWDLPGEPRAITTEPVFGYDALVWSPDGQWLAFTERTLDYQNNLMLYNLAEDKLTRAVENVADAFPVSFSMDSEQIYFVQINPESDPAMGPLQKLDVFALDLTSGAEPEYVNSFNFGVGCGGGSPFPADWLYWDDTGFGGFFLVLEITPYGLVHSMTCGGTETALLNLETGEDVSLGKVSRVKVSPDRSQIIGIEDLAGTRENESVILVDLETREQQILPVSGSADQLAWGAPGSDEIFYSQRRNTDQRIGTEAERAKLGEVFGSPLDVYQSEVMIFRFALASQTDEAIYSAPAYAIGRMAMSREGDALIFSQISNMERWVTAVGDETISLEDAYDFQKAQEYVPLVVFRLPLKESGPEELLTLNLTDVALYPAVPA